MDDLEEKNPLFYPRKGFLKKHRRAKKSRFTPRESPCNQSIQAKQRKGRYNTVRPKGATLFFAQKKSPASGTFLFYLQPVEQQNRAVPSRCAVKVKAKKIKAVVQSTHDSILMAKRSISVHSSEQT
jgi:hypothetical protein